MNRKICLLNLTNKWLVAILFGFMACNHVYAQSSTNNNFNSRIQITTNLPVSETGDNLGAGRETGEPDHAGEPASASVWWSWTPTNSNRIEIDTIGSDFDTLLAVYTGTNLSTLAEVDSNDQTGGDQSRVRFQANMGTTYQIAVDGYRGDQGEIVLHIGVAPDAPTNDNFESLTSISTSLPAAITNGTNVGASSQTGEPDHDGLVARSSVWWHWTASLTGRVEIDTFGSSTGTILAVYTGPDVSNLNPIASNDDAGGGIQSRVRFPANEGTIYRIAVDGFQGNEGDIVLNIGAAQDAPANDNFTDATPISVFPTNNMQGSNIGASPEPQEPPHTGIDFPATSSVWWRWSAGSPGRVEIDTFGSDFDTVLVVYTGTTLSNLMEVASNDDTEDKQSRVRFDAIGGTDYFIAVDGFQGDEGGIHFSIRQALTAPGNDGFMNPTPITDTGVLPINITGSNLWASSEVDEPNHHSPSTPQQDYTPKSTVWWSWTPTPTSSGLVQIDTFDSDFDTILAVYIAGTDLATLVKVDSDDQTGGAQSRVRFNASTGTDYLIAVDGFDGDEGTIQLNIVEFLPPPMNDNFAGSTIISNFPALNQVGSNVWSTVEDNEPDHAGLSAKSSVWWTWMAANSERIEIDTLGSDFDTLLAVYTNAGTSLSNLMEVAGNDQIGTNDQSRVRFDAIAMTNYYIAVDGFLGDEGNIRLNIRQAMPAPSNDVFTNAEVIATVPTTNSTSNIGATAEIGEPDHASFDEIPATASVWWNWNATNTGSVAIDTFGSAFDTVLAVYTGTSLANLSEVAGNDDAGDGASLQSRVIFEAVSGTTYRIAVDDLEVSEGIVQLHVGRPVPLEAATFHAISPLSAEIQWNSISGATYQVTGSAGLTNLLWNLQQEITALGPTFTTTNDVSTNATGFFRVERTGP